MFRCRMDAPAARAGSIDLPCIATRTALSLLLGFFALGSASAAAPRPTSTNFIARRSAAPPETNANNRVDELLLCLLGPDVAVSNGHLNAKTNAAGTFVGKLSVLGFDQGIILSSGNIATLDGPNTGDATSTDNNDLGDPDLDALIPGYQTFDAAILEFDFQCSSAQEISFQYVFGSEEYNEYVDSPYNDVFGFFLNGVNIAGAPAGCSNAGIPVSINNVNCGNPYVGSGPNCDCFRNNDLDDGGGLINTEMDGLTQVFFATGTIQPGLNHIKIAIADAGDHVLDSNVMIRCQSFACGGAPTVGSCCLNSEDCVTLTYEDCIANGGEFHGDLVPCSPNPCSEAVGACCFPNHACEFEGRHGCEQNGGTYLGDNIACAPDPCPLPSGACCHDGICEIVTHAECGGDTYLGDGTTCDPFPCGGTSGVGPQSGTPGFFLSTPSPTPSHGSVGVTWSLPQPGMARLTLWDASGRQRATLLSESVNAGTGHRVFELRDDAGRALPSGMYWVRLEAGRFGATQKVVIVN